MADFQHIHSSDNHVMDIDIGEDISHSNNLDSLNNYFDGLDNFNKQMDISHTLTPSSSGEHSVENSMSLSYIELEDGRTPLTFVRFLELPRELQMSVWKFTALHDRRTIIMSFERDKFMFANCPYTPALMHACHRSRRYGLKIFKPVDVYGNPRDIGIPPDYENYSTCVAHYFFVNPISDDFILKFGDETFCSQPVYCPIESKISSHNFELLAAAEEEFQNRHSQRRQTPNGFPRPGEPVFPPADILPYFFTNIRSVGINFNLPFPQDFNFSDMSPESLQTWARDAIKTHFDNVFTDILNQFPKLEYAFAVVRAHGRSNQELNERLEPGKENWKSVGIANAEGVIMGKEEFRQLEFEGRRWFMQRIDGGGGLNVVDFELYVQRNLYWEI